MSIISSHASIIWNHISVILDYMSVIFNHASVIFNHASVIFNHVSVIWSHVSAISNHMSVILNYASVISKRVFSYFEACFCIFQTDLGKVSWTRVKPRKIDIIKTFFRILRDSDSQCSNVASRYCKKSRRNQKSSILLPFWFLVSYLKNILFSVYAKDFL